MAHNMFHESGQDGRSVLGMLSVQVERDPKTGATVVRSVAPVSSPAQATTTATTIFDDGRKSIHTVGGSGDQPSTEELGQILGVIDGVGMKVLLDEVTVTPTQTQDDGASVKRVPPVEVKTVSAHAERGPAEDQDWDPSPKVGNRNMMVVHDMEGKEVNIAEQDMEDGPVTLLFLGYDDSTTNQDDGQEGYGGMLTVERVIITEDGEVIAPEETQEQDETRQAVPQEPSNPQQDTELKDSPKASAADDKALSKRKKCQCCSVM
ncbi:uncharacterized protein ACB058_021097 isoform 1-T2 [Synchiropus picturatus]